MNNTYASLKTRAANEIGMELFRDTVRLNEGVTKYHLRADKKSAAWPHFKNLTDVAEYLDNCAQQTE